MNRDLSSRVYSKLFRILSRIGVAQRISVCLPSRLVGGRRFHIPVLMSVGLGNEQMGDSWALEIISKLLPDCPGTFLDVGANVGQTLLKVKSCSPDGPWLGFEPNPTCVMYLEKLIEVNRFNACSIIPAGLGAETGVKELEFYDDDPADKAASLVKNFRPAQRILRRQWVPVLEFSALSRSGFNETIGFVKIDVEGGEKEVLESLQSVLEKFRPVVMLEILPVYKEENRERLARQRAVEKQFRGLDYTVCRIEKSPTDHYLGLRPMSEIGIHDQLVLSDYLAVPSERLESTLAKLGGTDGKVVAGRSPTQSTLQCLLKCVML